MTINATTDLRMHTIGAERAVSTPSRLRPVIDTTGEAAEGGRTVDRVRAQAAVTELLKALGRDPRSEHLAETPRRVTDAFIEQLTQSEFAPTTFPNTEGYDELVLVRDIPFHSLCEHHLLPFQGIAHVGYIPGDRLIGLSKLARVVDFFSHDLQVQERLTRQVANWIESELDPVGVGVVMEAEHTCMTIRGIQARGARTVTSAFTGVLKDRADLRGQFFCDGRR